MTASLALAAASTTAMSQQKTAPAPVLKPIPLDSGPGGHVNMNIQGNSQGVNSVGASGGDARGNGIGASVDTRGNLTVSGQSGSGVSGSATAGPDGNSIRLNLSTTFE
jgi:hypothetical protein